MEKKSKTTLQTYKTKQAESIALSVAKYGVCAVPATIITGINWNEWFSQTGGSLPFGFATLLIALLTTIFAVTKEDNEKEEKVSNMYFIAGIIVIWGVAFMLLANILQTMGQMFLFTAIGIAGGATADQVNKNVVIPQVTEYKQLVEDNCLDKKSLARFQRKEKAKAEREAQAKAEAEASYDGRSI